MKKVLMILTNQDHYDAIERANGVWMEEAATFVEIIRNAGYQLDYASPKGGRVPIDPTGLNSDDPATLRVYNDPDFIERGMKHSLKTSEIHSSEYIAVYFCGGHGASLCGRVIRPQN